MSESQDLCSKCGLCCKGALHQRVPLQEEEVVPLLKLIPKSVFRVQGEPQMYLPCKAYSEGLCSIYNERPQRCRAYQCKLLVKLQNNEIQMNEALATIEQAKSDLDNKEFLAEHFEDQLAR